MQSAVDLFIAGTDTGVGKSVVSLLIMKSLFARGQHPFYLKLFQTGCEHSADVRSDARFIYDHIEALKGRDPGASVIFCHRLPRAPYYAAERTGERIDLTLLAKHVAEKRRVFSPLVIEGSGGLLVPVTKDKLVVDVIRTLRCRLVLVARAGLGTINHTLLSLEAARRRQIEPLGVVLVDADLPPTEQDLVDENIDAIQRFGNVPVAGVIGRLEDFRRPPDSVTHVIARVLE